MSMDGTQAASIHGARMTGVAIRRATPGDAPAIARVRVDSWRATYRGMIPDAYLDAMKVEASTAIWDRVLNAGVNTTCVFVAAHGSDVVGFSCGNRLAEAKHGFDAELAAVYLRREFQRAGLGHQLVGAVAEAQRGVGATGLITWVIAGNKPAREFYQRLGGELVIEQPFNWDGMDLVEAGYGWRDLAQLAAGLPSALCASGQFALGSGPARSCAPALSETGT